MYLDIYLVDVQIQSFDAVFEGLETLSGCGNIHFVASTHKRRIEKIILWRILCKNSVSASH